MPCPVGKDRDESGIPAAAAAARAADVAVLFVGSDQTTEAESFDRARLGLAGVQEALFAAVVAANPRTVVVLINGGPIAAESVKEKAAAVVEAFYPGQLGGDGIVSTLTGAANKFGRMPYTTYFKNFTARDVRDVDLAHGSGVTYRHFAGPVLWPFGAGLSYTTFSYRWSDAAAAGQVCPTVASIKLAAESASVIATRGAGAHARHRPRRCGARGRSDEHGRAQGRLRGPRRGPARGVHAPWSHES